MNPGILVADVAHFKEIFVQAGIYQCFLKKRFMGFGRAGRHHDTIQIFFLDDLRHNILRVLGAGVQVIAEILHIRQRCSVIPHCRNIHHTRNVDAAAAHKNADSGSLAEYIGFRDDLRCFGLGVTGGTESGTGCAGCRTGVDNRLRDILGTLKCSADIDAFS